ncbi:phage portal protein [Fodinicurvata fenggangensis]|uniref:phage portal protein n=1 Tax=Fodinicurvata fenggangensis TaxID=1121830 RepID=UPI00068A1ABB|nr:phage portal protein [Fodinicurvata fenggangensis]
MLERLRTFLGKTDTEQKSSLAAPSAELLALFGAPRTAAGVSVTPETALKSPTCLAATRVLSETIGSLPFHCFRRGNDGSRERETDHAAARLLGGRWAPWSSSSEVRCAMQVDAILHGQAFAQVVRAGGQPREIHRLDPRSVTVEQDPISLEPSFRVQYPQGGDRVLHWRDVLHVTTPGSTIDRPLCLISEAREAISVDLLMAEHHAKLFANGARPGGVLTYPKALSPEIMERLKRSFESAHAGGQNSGRTMVLEDGMEYQATQFSSVDLQFLELKKHVIQQIASAFRVPPILLADLERATWRNAEELGRQFLQFTLLPWLEQWQAALERVLLNPEDEDRLFIEPMVDDLLRADLSARFTAYREACGGSWMTPNEIRRLDNMGPVEGGDSLIRQAGQSDGEDGFNEEEDAA